jgi:hypothetical protein
MALGRRAERGIRLILRPLPLNVAFKCCLYIKPATVSAFDRMENSASEIICVTSPSVVGLNRFWSARTEHLRHCISQ